jgi:L-iditol 2-dehydrogenase
MKALLLVDKKKLELTDLPLPSLGAGDLLVRVKACGICGSDVHGYDGSTGRRIPPVVMGHEAAGVVQQIGLGVNRFSPGDRITFDSTIYCGECDFCRAGKINLCDRRRVLGVSSGEYRQNGCFAEFAAIPQRIAYQLPDAMPFEDAAMVEAVSIAIHAVGRARVESAITLVVGAGMIGQLIIQASRAAGCATLIAVDLDETRLERAKKFGADHVLNAASPDLVATIQQLTNGGAQVVFDAVGISESMNTSIRAARKGATVVLVGNISPNVETPLQLVVTRELSLFGSCASCGEYPQCLELMAQNKINVRPLISAIAPLEEGAQWFSRLYAREPGLMKIILKP